MDAGICSVPLYSLIRWRPYSLSTLLPLCTEQYIGIFLYHSRINHSLIAGRNALLQELGDSTIIYISRPWISLCFPSVVYLAIALTHTVFLFFRSSTHFIHRSSTCYIDLFLIIHLIAVYHDTGIFLPFLYESNHSAICRDVTLYPAGARWIPQ